MTYELQIVRKKGRITGGYPTSKTKKIQIIKFKHVLPLVQEIADHPQEHVIVISMDDKHNVLASRVVYIGTADECVVGTRDIFRGLIADNATCMILVHNHPGGDLEPSKKDTKFIRDLCKTGKLLDISVIDSVIVSKDGIYSMNKKKTIKTTSSKAPVTSKKEVRKTC